MLKLDGVSHRWQAFTLSNIHLTVGEHDYCIILGPSGAGKTLLLELIAGITMPEQGSITIGGADVTALPPERRGIAYIPQEYALFPHLPVFENIAYGLKMQNILAAERKSRVSDIATVLGIGHLQDRKPASLSGGEKQRVAIARALVCEPRLLLLDEPFANLDAPTRRTLISELKEWQKAFGVTAVHVTHSFEEAIRLGERVGIMLDGALVQTGAIREVFASPENEAVARFLGFETIIDGTVKGTRFTAGDFSVPCAAVPSGAVRIGIRPESVMLVADGREQDGDIAGTLTLVEDYGMMLRLSFDVGGVVLSTYITHATALEQGIREGRIFRLRIAPQALRVLG